MVFPSYGTFHAEHVRVYDRFDWNFGAGSSALIIPSGIVIDSPAGAKCVRTLPKKKLHLRELRFDALVLAVPANFLNEALVLEFIQIKGLSSTSQSPGTLACYRYAMSKDGEPDEEPNNLLQSRMNALLAYLRSEMLDRSAPPQSNDEWVWEGPGNQTLWDDEEPD